jgi:hypothetical protein
VNCINEWPPSAARNCRVHQQTTQIEFAISRVLQPRSLGRPNGPDRTGQSSGRLCAPQSIRGARRLATCSSLPPLTRFVRGPWFRNWRKWGHSDLSLPSTFHKLKIPAGWIKIRFSHRVNAYKCPTGVVYEEIALHEAGTPQYWHSIRYSYHTILLYYTMITISWGPFSPYTQQSTPSNTISSGSISMLPFNPPPRTSKWPPSLTFQRPELCITRFLIAPYLTLISFYTKITQFLNS